MKWTNSQIPSERLTATPELRFPDFRDAPSWEGKELVAIADPIVERADNEAQHNVLTLSGEHGLVLQSEYFGKQIAGTSSDRYLRIQRDDFVYNDRTTKASEYGTIKRLKHHPHGIVSPIYKCFRFKEGELPSFWEWYFESGAHEAQLRSLANEGARAGRFNVSIGRFLSTTVFSPDPQSAEQAKIAECLSTLDELIGAESQKLDALKAHKKGLMQQLFPPEGETRPRLRFPEFRDAPEWALTTVGELVQTNCLFPPRDGNHGNIHPKSSDYVATGIPFVMASDLKAGLVDTVNCHFISKEVADSLQKGFARQGDVLLSHKGTVGEVALVGKISTPYLMLTPQVTYYRVKDEKRLSNLFLAQSFVSDEFQWNLIKASGGGTRSYIGITEQANLSVRLPKNVAEQQRIATCLSSLDGLASAQQDRLRVLKIHKLGLMQQLFPSPPEAEG